MKCLILVLLNILLVYGKYEKERLALQNPDLFQGDILGIDPGDRNVVPDAEMRWPNGNIPYVIDEALEKYKSLIMEAMLDYRVYTCVNFVPRTDEKNYIRIFSGEGCYSYVGMKNVGRHPVSLGPGCMMKGTILHELGHVIGFYHEHNRSDRDEYITIIWKNIQSGMENQFVLLRPEENLLLTDFDYDSIMLYGNFAYSTGLATMVAKNGKRLQEPFQKGELSLSDMKRIRQMYGCSKN